jgi:hypothetical protein
MSTKITLAIRPSLAFPKRWSIDYWEDDHVDAAYQAMLVTYESPDEAAKVEAAAQLSFEKQGAEVSRVQIDSNSSRRNGEPADETEEEISKRLEAHVKSIFLPLQTLTLASLFDITRWGKGLKAVVTGSPLILSLLILVALLIRGPFERLLASIVPKGLNLNSAELFASAPLLLLVTTLYVYLRRAQISSQLDRVRQWILQLVISYGWDRDRFQKLGERELKGLEYSTVVDILEEANKRDPSSYCKLIQALGKNLKDDRELAAMVLRDDFARKIQALAGIAAEPDYRPSRLAISPFLLLISLASVKATTKGLLLGTESSVAAYRAFSEAMVLIGSMIAILISLLAICPTLVWTTALSWRVSSLLFISDVFASALTVWLLTRRPLLVIFRRSFVPKGLGLNECMGALNI